MYAKGGPFFRLQDETEISIHCGSPPLLLSSSCNSCYKMFNIRFPNILSGITTNMIWLWLRIINSSKNNPIKEWDLRGEPRGKLIVQYVWKHKTAVKIRKRQQSWLSNLHQHHTSPSSKSQGLPPSSPLFTESPYNKFWINYPSFPFACKKAHHSLDFFGNVIRPEARILRLFWKQCDWRNYNNFSYNSIC